MIFLSFSIVLQSYSLFTNSYFPMKIIHKIIKPLGSIYIIDFVDLLYPGHCIVNNRLWIMQKKANVLSLLFFLFSPPTITTWKLFTNILSARGISYYRIFRKNIKYSTGICLFDDKQVRILWVIKISNFFFLTKLNMNILESPSPFLVIFFSYIF